MQAANVKRQLIGKDSLKCFFCLLCLLALIVCVWLNISTKVNKVLSKLWIQKKKKLLKLAKLVDIKSKEKWWKYQQVYWNKNWWRKKKFKSSQWGRINWNINKKRDIVFTCGHSLMISFVLVTNRNSLRKKKTSQDVKKKIHQFHVNLWNFWVVTFCHKYFFSTLALLAPDIKIFHFYGKRVEQK